MAFNLGAIIQAVQQAQQQQQSAPAQAPQQRSNNPFAVGYLDPSRLPAGFFAGDPQFDPESMNLTGNSPDKPYVSMWGQQMGLDNNYNYAIMPNGSVEQLFQGSDPNAAYYDPENNVGTPPRSATMTASQLANQYGWDYANAARDAHGYAMPGRVDGLDFLPSYNPGQHDNWFWDKFAPQAAFTAMTMGVGGLAAAGAAAPVAAGGAGLGSATAGALGGGMAGAASSGAAGGNPLTGALTGAAGGAFGASGAGQNISDAVGGGTVGNMAQGAVSSGLKSILTGKNPLMGAVSGAAGAGVGDAINGIGNTIQGSFGSNTLNGGTVDDMDLGGWLGSLDGEDMSWGDGPEDTSWGDGPTGDENDWGDGEWGDGSTSTGGSPAGGGSGGMPSWFGHAAKIFGPAIANGMVNAFMGNRAQHQASDLIGRSDPLNQSQRKPYQDMAQNLLSNPQDYMQNNPFAKSLTDLYKNHVIPANMAKSGNTGFEADRSGAQFATALSGNYNNLAQILAGYGGFSQGGPNTGAAAPLYSQSNQNYGEIFRGAGDAASKMFGTPQAPSAPQTNPITGSTVLPQ